MYCNITNVSLHGTTGTAKVNQMAAWGSMIVGPAHFTNSIFFNIFAFLLNES
jgi:hypothetical protein